MRGEGQIYHTLSNGAGGRISRSRRQEMYVSMESGYERGGGRSRLMQTRTPQLKAPQSKIPASRGRSPAGSVPPASSQGRSSRKESGGIGPWLLWLLIVAMVFAAGLGTGWYIWERNTGSTVSLASIQAPEWIDQRLIRKNIYSRPAVSLRQVNDIVVHYVANPMSSAEDNRNYFDRLADQSGDGATSASAHFVIGLEGEIIQCIPVNEIAYASNNRNSDSIAIECCHPDETGEFTEATYDSLVKLTAWLCDETGISRKSVIRHYDITGKDCPRYFVGDEDAWKQFKKDVQAYQGDWGESGR